MDVHTGTHLEAPLHALRDGVDLDARYPWEFCGLVQVLDVPNDSSSLNLDPIPDHVKGLLFRTSNSSRNLWARKGFVQDFAGLCIERAEAIAALGRFEFVGADYLSIEAHETKGKVHQILLESDIWIIEGLDLRQTPPGTYQMLGLFLRIEGAEAAPGRVLLSDLSDLDSRFRIVPC